MLFDLQGPRKTAVKAIYLGLAILMAGGLVLFGIGSSINGGLADVFTNGSSTGDLQKQVEKSQKAYAANPKDPKTLQNLIADRVSWAGSDKNYNQANQTFNAEGKKQLTAVTKDWLAYKQLTNKPDLNTAGYAVSAYAQLNDAKGAQQAQAVVAERQPSAANYLALLQFALYAGDNLTASGAEIKARELATKDQQAEVKQQIKSLKKQVAQRGAELQKQIQQQFAQQQQSQGGAPTSPFGNLQPSSSAAPTGK
jgi:hypothetical protein